MSALREHTDWATEFYNYINQRKDTIVAGVEEVLQVCLELKQDDPEGKHGIKSSHINVANFLDCLGFEDIAVLYRKINDIE